MTNTDKNKEKRRDDITGNRAFTDISQLILFILFITIWILDSFFLKNIYFFYVYLPTIFSDKPDKFYKVLILKFLSDDSSLHYLPVSTTFHHHPDFFSAHVLSVLYKE